MFDVVSFCFRVAEKEPVNKMSLHNLATVFGPTLLRPSESEINKPHITLASDIWSHDVMAQVRTHFKTRGYARVPNIYRNTIACTFQVVCDLFKGVICVFVLCYPCMDYKRKSAKMKVREQKMHSI